MPQLLFRAITQKHNFTVDDVFLAQHDGNNSLKKYCLNIN